MGNKELSSERRQNNAILIRINNSIHIMELRKKRVLKSTVYIESRITDIDKRIEELEYNRNIIKQNIRDIDRLLLNPPSVKDEK